MKIVLLLTLSLITLAGVAQDCSTYFPFVEGRSWEVSNYNKKGKLEGTSLNTVKSISKVEEGTKASVTIKMLDAKKKDDVEVTYDMTCTGDEVMVSMKMFLPSEQLEQMKGYESMEVKMDMDDMAFPNDLTVGQELKDCSMTMEIASDGMTMMSTTTKIKNRKVLDKLTVTTAAGDFECFKITQTSEISIGPISREYKSISYISEGVGVVKSESYDKKGELNSYSEISKVN